MFTPTIIIEQEIVRLPLPRGFYSHLHPVAIREVYMMLSLLASADHDILIWCVLVDHGVPLTHLHVLVVFIPATVITTVNRETQTLYYDYNLVVLKASTVITTVNRDTQTLYYNYNLVVLIPSTIITTVNRETQTLYYNYNLVVLKASTIITTVNRETQTIYYDYNLVVLKASTIRQKDFRRQNLMSMLDVRI